MPAQLRAFTSIPCYIQFQELQIMIIYYKFLIYYNFKQSFQIPLPLLLYTSKVAPKVLILANQTKKNAASLCKQDLTTQFQTWQTQLNHGIQNGKSDTSCAFDIPFYLTPLGQARQFIETCGTKNLLCRRKFVYFLGQFVVSAQVAKK